MQKILYVGKILLNGTEVEYGDDMKYLGVILNSFLLWRPTARKG